MSVEATTQVLADSVDSAGISVVTSTGSSSNQRRGRVYNPATLAAAVPVWFHRLHNGQYLSLFSKRWTDATVSLTTVGPHWYTDYTESTVPSWAMVDPTTGIVENITTIPSNLSGTRTLIAAVSYRDYIFTLGTVDGKAFVQHHRMNDRGGLLLQAEEILPVSAFVQSFNRGLCIDGLNLCVFGTDVSGYLIMARKSWGRIGASEDSIRRRLERELADKITTALASVDQDQIDALWVNINRLRAQYDDELPGWEYRGDKGWYTSMSETLVDDTVVQRIQPIKDSNGDPIVVSGPVSAAKVRDRTYLAVTTHSGSQWSAKFFTSRNVDPAWTPTHSPISLGDDDTYAGGGLYLQPQLPANTALYGENTRTGYPYVLTRFATDTADDEDETVSSSLNTSWGLFQV